ncbi:uncharacterized protein DEA37_0008102 [Paragonimus westermani]|uniref:Uncharacterized protein n=1 Tax=Paragonimus westermani TaxID=34504 RepID=A0A5J4P0K9_9TREM|nr:uncharacterized protein DEA37_0008102 [Paragonimus westermani]
MYEIGFSFLVLFSTICIDSITTFSIYGKRLNCLWSTECCLAFSILKSRFSVPTILGIPDFSPLAGSFMLDTDVATCAEAVLSAPPSGNIISRMIRAFPTFADSSLRETLNQLAAKCKVKLPIVFRMQHTV